MNNRLSTLVAVSIGICLAAICPMSQAQVQISAMQSDGVTARALLYRCDDRVRMGQAYLQERASLEGVKQVDVAIRVTRFSGLPAGNHAVHIHQTAQCEPCSAAGGHFDPGPFGHTNPDGNHPFHAGDLVNLKLNSEGSGTLFTTTSRISLSRGPLSLFDEDGSAFVVHVLPDAYCPDGPVAGCAGGARAACGIITRD